MTRATVRLFVYGSLKRGGRHHDELQAAGATFLGEAETLPGYRLEALNVGAGETDGYLALVHARPDEPDEPFEPDEPDEPNVVTGELFEVPESELPALDAFEGDAYARGAVRLRNTGQIARIDDGMESLAYFRKAR